ncbi:MAG: hypothetical protein FWC85_05325, partial [Elusimicrobia bacterium]|nr:hypothetical protein [Elusimicrobiota bacterium]
LADFFGRFSGKNLVSGANTALVMSGNIGFENFTLNGYLNITAQDGVSVMLSGALENAGVQRNFMSAGDVLQNIQSSDIEVVQEAMRAERFNVNAALNINFVMPGNYTAVVKGNQLVVTRAEDGAVRAFELTGQTQTIEVGGIANTADITINGEVIEITRYMDENATDVLTNHNRPLDNFVVSGNNNVRLRSLDFTRGGTVKIISNSRHEVEISAEMLVTNFRGIEIADGRAVLENAVITIDERGNISSLTINGVSATKLQADRGILAISLLGHGVSINRVADIIAAMVSGIDFNAKAIRELNREGMDMRFMLPFIANINTSHIERRSESDIRSMVNAIMATVFSVELSSAQDIVTYREALQTLMREARNANKRVVLNFRPESPEEAEAIIEMIKRGDLANLRINFRNTRYLVGVDGVKFDFTAIDDVLTADRFNGIRTSLENVPSMVVRENSTPTMLINSKHYGRSQNNLIQGIDDFNDFVNLSGIYNKSTVDAESRITAAMNAVQDGAPGIFSDYEFFEMLALNNIGMDSMQVRLVEFVREWARHVGRSPESMYRTARRTGFGRIDVIEAAQANEAELLAVLANLKTKGLRDESGIAPNQTSDHLRIWLSKVLDVEERTVATVAGARGHLRGVLERMLIERIAATEGRVRSFAYITNMDVYRTTLVMAAMNGLSDDQIIGALRNTKGKSLVVLLGDEEGIGIVTQEEANRLTFASAQSLSQIAINTAISELERQNIENGNEAQAIALESLLFKLGGFDPLDIRVTRASAVSTDIRAVQAILAAA